MLSSGAGEMLAGFFTAGRYLGAMLHQFLPAEMVELSE